MKKLSVLFGILFFFFSFVRLSYGAVTNTSVINDIQKDHVNLNGEHIQSFTSSILINKDGTIEVKENIVYDFGDLYKHGIYRDIPYTKTNTNGKKYKMDLNIESVVDDNGKSYQYTLSDLGDKTEIKIGDPNNTITGLHTYAISYKVSGALTYFSDHDELYWNETGNDWTIPIKEATATIELPTVVDASNIKTTCYTGSYGTTDSACTSSFSQNTMSVKTNNILNADQGLTFALSFPKNIVTVLEPKEIIPFEQTLIGKLFFLAIGLLSLFWYVIYPFIIIIKWFKYGRDPSTRSARSGQVPGVVTAWFDPPKTPKGRFMTPGEVGTLGDETVDMKDISATIVDLARRGYIKIEEKKKGDYFFVKTKDFSLGLLSFEQTLLTGMFGSKKEIRLKDAKLYQTVNDVTKELYDDVVTEGLFPKNPQSIRTFYTVISGIALFTGNFFLAIVAFIFGRNMPRKTVDGVNAYNVAKSLKNFLTSQERQLEFQAKNQMMFEKLLPFAIAFGVEKIWAKRFATMNLTQPDWYQGYGSNQFNSIIFASSLNSSLSNFSNASRPPTSTSGTSGFSSGFSGGFSGGGGGGGGGGSW